MTPKVSLKVSLKMSLKASLKAFFHARTQTLSGFVELNKTAWATVFEAKSPKKSLKRRFNAQERGGNGRCIFVFSDWRHQTQPMGILVP